MGLNEIERILKDRFTAGVFVFDAQPSDAFGLTLVGDGTYKAPEPLYEALEVPGRNGLVYVPQNRYSNAEVVYKGSILDDFETNYKALCDYLTTRPDYAPLSDTWHAGVFTYAHFEKIDVEPLKPQQGNPYGAANVEITFSRKPQWFTFNGQQFVSVTSGQSLYNPSNQKARPVFKVTGNGTLTTGDFAFTISGNGANTVLTVDCSIMECYAGDVNYNSLITCDDFPQFVPGENGISFTGFSNVQVAPQWWFV